MNNNDPEIDLDGLDLHRSDGVGSGSVLLGSLVGHPDYHGHGPKHQLIVDGRSLEPVIIRSKDFRSQNRGIRLLTLGLGLPELVHKDAFFLWKRLHPVKGKGKLTYATFIYIAARMHGIRIDAGKLLGMSNPNSGADPQKFVNRTLRKAFDLGITLPRLDHDRIALRAVDELGIDRKFYLKAKRLYPAARHARGGNPSTTLATLIYLMANPFYPRLSEYDLDLKFGLAKCTVGNAAVDLRRRMGDVISAEIQIRVAPRAKSKERPRPPAVKPVMDSRPREEADALPTLKSTGPKLTESLDA